MIYKYFLTTCKLSFHSLNEKAEVLLKKQKFLISMNSGSKISFFMDCAVGVTSKKSMPKSKQ